MGAILIFLFGIHPRINPEGHINLILEQTDEKEKKKARVYISISYLGVSLLIMSFLLQVIISIK